jgi:selenophosphate synthetase-related protein
MSDSSEPPVSRADLAARDYTWMDAIEEVIDASIDEEADLEASFEDLTVDVPLAYGDDAERARWGFDGTVRVSVDGMRGHVAEWIRWWAQRQDGE